MSYILTALTFVVIGQNPGQVKITPLAQIPGDVYLPAFFSADQKTMLFLKSTPGAGFRYCIADADGKNVHEVYTTPVHFEDVLGILICPGSMSKDGKRFAVLTTKDCKPYRSSRDGPLHTAICDRKGQLTKVPITKATTGCGFVGNRLMYLDCAFPQGGGPAQNGYLLKMWTGKKAVVIEQNAAQLGFGLRASPTGKQVAFFVATPLRGPGRPDFRIRVVDLKTKKAIESKPFPGVGNPVMYWDAEGKGLYYYNRSRQPGNRDYRLMRFDVTTKQSTRITKQVNLFVFAVLDKNHLGVRMRNPELSGILRLSDEKMFLLPRGITGIGGRGNRLLLKDTNNDVVFAASFQLSK